MCKIGAVYTTVIQKKKIDTILSTFVLLLLTVHV
jgi:hypothetical protein